jgi:hypothetical protein
MQALPGDNGPDQGQTLAAADRWRTNETQRELGMLVEVRGGASWRFSAPQSPICCSLSPPALLCLEPHRAAAAAFPGPVPRAAGRSIRPLRGSAVRSSIRTADCVLQAGVQVGDGGASGTIIAFFGSIVTMSTTHSPHSLRAAGRSIRSLRV